MLINMANTSLVLGRWTAGRVRGDCVIVRRRGDWVRVVLVDAAGHDIGAQKIVDALRVPLRRDLTSPIDEASLRRWSDLIHARFGDEGGFACFTLIELNVRGGEMRVANGGNPDLLIRRANLRLEHFSSTGMPLGAVAASEWKPPVFRATYLGKHDHVVLFSDGLIDRLDERGDRFGIERVRDAARAGGRRLLNALRDGVERFSARLDGQDDLSVVVLSSAPAA